MNATRRQWGWLFFLLACAAVGTLLTACGGSGPPPPPPPTITTTTVPDGVGGQPYSQTLMATGGTGSLTWSLAAGSTLPAGLSLSSAGVISGTPSATGTFNFTVQVQDSASPPRTATQALTLSIVSSVLTITTTTLPGGVTSQLYNQTLQASGGIPPRTWSISVGTLPTGLSLGAANGVISGTPNTPGTFNFTVQVRDAGSPQQTATKTLSINVVAGTLAIATTRLPAGTVNVFYSARPSAIGGTPPFIWTLQGGTTLPPGLALNPSTGEISGTTTMTGPPVNFTLQVNDSAAQSATKALSITVTPASGAGSLGRNDTIAKATPLSNGTYQASISPLVDPPTSATANPDNDIYQLTANGGAIATIEITAQRLTPSSPLDSVIEIIDLSGARLTTCRTPTNTTGLFNEPCMNDDIISFLVTDSRLEFQVPVGPAQTIFVRVLDFRGDARPDFIYTITITGVN